MDEPAIKQGMIRILGDLDALDSASFDPTEYVNALFPTEQAFANIDDVQRRLGAKIKKLDRSLRERLREQTAEGELVADRQELDIALAAVQKLYAEIRTIKEKARHAEQTVQYITKDIKSLDCAKKNITTSINLLRKLQMLASGVDQLRAATSKRIYADVVPLLQAVQELSETFKTFRGIKQIADLLDGVQGIKADLKRMAFSDFEGSFNAQGALTGSPETLRAACEVVNVLEMDVKKHLVDWYCEIELREYTGIFRYNDEVGNLDNIGRRFAWLKRLLKTFDGEHVHIFPTEWNVSLLLCQRFCQLTKEDMDGLLGRTQMDVETMMKNLQITLEFETGLNRRFTTVQEGATKLKILDIFSGAISQSFEPYLKLYIEAEDRKLAEMMENAKINSDVSDDDTRVFKSSTDLFIFYRKTLVNMAKLSTRKPFQELAKMFAKYLLLFSDILASKIPKDEKRAASAKELSISCLVMNTAEYCHNTTAQLEDKIKEKISPELREMVSLSLERENFLILTTNAVQALVRQMSSCLFAPFQAMGKIPWSSLQSVGDQSEYVTQIGSAISTNMSVIRKTINTPKHLKWFCDNSFVPYFVKNIHGSKPISEVGAEQMLLDLHAVKTILLEIPSMGAEQKIPPTAMYTKFVVNGMYKVETLLKVVLTSLDPPEAIIKNFLVLSSNGEPDVNWAQCSPQQVGELRDNFLKILDLKGVRKQEQQQLLDLLMSHFARTNGTGAPAVNNTMTPSSAIGGSTSVPTTTSAMRNSVADAGVKLSENVKKLMDMKGGWSMKK